MVLFTVQTWEYQSSYLTLSKRVTEHISQTFLLTPSVTANYPILMSVYAETGLQLAELAWSSAGFSFCVTPMTQPCSLEGEMGDHTDHWSRNRSPGESYLLHLSLRLTFFWQHSPLLAFHPYLGCWPQEVPEQSERSSLCSLSSACFVQNWSTQLDQCCMGLRQFRSQLKNVIIMLCSCTNKHDNCVEYHAMRQCCKCMQNNYLN